MMYTLAQHIRLVYPRTLPTQAPLSSICPSYSQRSIDSIALSTLHFFVTSSEVSTQVIVARCPPYEHARRCLVSCILAGDIDIGCAAFETSADHVQFEPVMLDLEPLKLTLELCSVSVPFTNL